MDYDDPRVQAIHDRMKPGRSVWREVEHGPGWLPVVADLNEKIAALFPDYEVQQVKQKFCGLRYYCNVESDARVHMLIRAAERACDKTCEDCGATFEPKEYYGRHYCPTCEALPYEETQEYKMRH